MAKTQYLSIWKDDQFWIRVKDVYWGIFGLVEFLYQIVSDTGYSAGFQYISVSLFLFGGVVDAITENISKETTELKNRVFSRLIFVLILASISFTALYYYAGDKSTLAFILTGSIIFFTFFEMIFKKRFSRSNTILKYLFNDTPTIFTKSYFQENGVFKNIVTGVVYLGMLGYAIYFLFFRIS